MNSPGGHTPSEIQSHLYLSFLLGHTSDVRLHIKGGWEAVYRLHRVVLIQAGFFRSLFTAGFLESDHASNSASYFRSPPDEVDVRFDDVNITRSAFEICIARLYGGGPELYLSPSLIPTPVCPLTPSFSSLAPIAQAPPGHHPATPRFLLSLLSTSIYLSIPSITSQALSMVLSSVGPHTVNRYLGFAIGHGIGPLESDEPEAAVGLEGVGKAVHYRDDEQSFTYNSKQEEYDGSDMTRKLSSLDFEEDEVKEQASTNGDSRVDEPNFNYGAIGDKVGEACACWLTRWGADILPCEENGSQESNVTSEPSSLLRPPEAKLSRRRVTMPSVQPLSVSGLPAPRLWAREGLLAPWVRAVISSDDFFIKDEWERYDFARRVVELRRRDGLDPHEEKEWEQLFQRGIHYPHMSFEELIRISHDASPITGRPYVPVETIHSAHWTQSLLRHRIITRSPVSGTASPPPPRDKELGITLSTAELLATLSPDGTSDVEKSKPYYPIPVDSSQRIGDTDSAFASANASADQLLANPPDLPGPGHTPTDQTNFFGIMSRRYAAASCIRGDATGKARWSPYAPFRFAVEFWGVGQLLEKSRLHSHTIWYAGSLFNVYVQVVRKKGVQLGVYLHRQSSVDPIPRASAPPVLVTTRAERMLNSSPSTKSPPSTPQTPRPQTPARGHNSVGSLNSLSNVAIAVPGSPRLAPSSPTASHFPPSTTSLTSASTSSPAVPVQPYRDPRSSISAHFTISCASATGSSLTRFSSSPDQFAISQSWGWKSSSLRTEEYIEVNGEAKPRDLSKEASLRATVVLGLI